jgi:hypothetical protein
MRNIVKALALAFFAGAAMSVRAGYTDSLFLLPSTTVDEYAISLNADGTCGAFITVVSPGTQTAVYVFRPETGTTPIQVGSNLQYVSRPKMSADGLAVAFWAKEEGQGIALIPYVFVWDPINEIWVQNTISVVSCLVADAGSKDMIPPAVSDDVDENHPRVVVFPDPLLSPVGPSRGRPGRRYG